jgi:hypothetical protein
MSKVILAQQKVLRIQVSCRLIRQWLPILAWCECSATRWWPTQCASYWQWSPPSYLNSHLSLWIIIRLCEFFSYFSIHSKSLSRTLHARQREALPLMMFLYNSTISRSCMFIMLLMSTTSPPWCSCCRLVQAVRCWRFRERRHTLVHRQSDSFRVYLGTAALELDVEDLGRIPNNSSVASQVSRPGPTALATVWNSVK